MSIWREPGFSYKETIKTGTLAARSGGYSDVCSMPNLDPVPDSVPHMMEQLKSSGATLACAFIRMPP